MLKLCVEWFSKTAPFVAGAGFLVVLVGLVVALFIGGPDRMIHWDGYAVSVASVVGVLFIIVFVGLVLFIVGWRYFRRG